MQVHQKIGILWRKAILASRPLQGCRRNGLIVVEIVVVVAVVVVGVKGIMLLWGERRKSSPPGKWH